MDQETNDKDVDVYRDTPLRLLGYSNELGEAFRVWVSTSWVRLSYGVASAYVLADAADKMNKFIKKQPDGADIKSQALRVAADTILWQALASVIIPGFTINRVCVVTYWTFGRATAISAVARKRAATAAGLGCIPLIVKPIDTLVDGFMDYLVRPHLSPSRSELSTPNNRNSSV